MRDAHRARPVQSLRVKLIQAFLVVALLPLFATSLYGNWTTSMILQDQALDAARVDLRLRAEQIEAYLGSARENLLFLSRLRSVSTLLAAPQSDPRLLAAVQADFVAFGATHPGLFQIRYLDASGWERIRVEARAADHRALPPERLQNKADRYYFAATMAMPKGTVYVSPVDLNREWKAIQLPYVSTVRYATPVFHPDATRAGIVVLNLYAEPFLRFARNPQVTTGRLALTDARGYYLVHPDPSKVMGDSANLASGASAARDFPVAWDEIAQAKDRASGVFMLSSGNWLTNLRHAILTVGLTLARNSSPRRILLYQEVRPNRLTNERWVLLYDVPRDNLFLAVWRFRTTALAIVTAAMLVALAIAVIIARNLSAPILALTQSVRDFGSGPPLQRVTIKLPRQRSGEIAELATAFEEMSEALNQHIEQLSERQGELRALVKKLINAQEEERRMVAFDLHDGLLQMLVGARLQLTNFMADREARSDQAQAALNKGLAELGEAIKEGRHVIEGLRPGILDDLGLVAALRELAVETSALCGWDLEFTATPPSLRAPPHVETTAFRIVQEALTNARKYSGTRRMRVGLRLGDETLFIEVRDWGSGFEPGSTPEGRGVGLTGMRERARLLGGSCEILSAPSQGTIVRAELPLATAKEKTRS